MTRKARTIREAVRACIELHGISDFWANHLAEDVGGPHYRNIVTDEDCDYSEMRYCRFLAESGDAIPERGHWIV